MSKLVKILVLVAYAVLFIQYLEITFSDPFIEQIDIKYIFRTPGDHKRLIKTLKKFGRNITPSLLKYHKPERFATDYKYILKWTDSYIHYSSSIYRNGQSAFITNNCSYNNCFLTNEKSLLLDIRNFDAIIFDVENVWDAYPTWRDEHQKYIFTASESAANYPVCHPDFDNYYNISWTYKLDSEIRWTYLSIYDRKGRVVGPKINMTWIEPMSPTPERISKLFMGKTKAAAWFVSNCHTKSGRHNYSKSLEVALKKYSLKIDIFGWCGKMSCPKDRMEDCLELLQTDYYFYLAFENSLSEDYVTEKILYPLRHYTVPIVFGGAEYSRFLPPKSYINARELSPAEVAQLMFKAIDNPDVYADYFRWHNYYEYREAFSQADVCNLCAHLNEEANKKSVIKNFRKWWNPNYEAACKNEFVGFLGDFPDNANTTRGEFINIDKNKPLEWKK